MLFEYSIIMTSSNTIGKGEEWPGSGETLFRWLINLYTSNRLSDLLFVTFFLLSSYDLNTG